MEMMISRVKMSSIRSSLEVREIKVVEKEGAHYSGVPAVARREA
jgi:hypothetical protein